MSFDFFTFGGNKNWADIFFYQKWRIQRNINDKEYRLLDPWDISRRIGTFEECRKKFVDYIEAYQISRQHGHMIIMLHGFNESKKVFRGLWRRISGHGFIAAALNYPSTKAPLDSHVKQLDFFLNNLEDVSEVSFVAKGASCLILRELFSLPSLWQKKLNIKRILFINPSNNGNDFVAWLAKFKLFRWFLGPMAAQISTENSHLIPKLPAKIEHGTIFCDSRFSKFIRSISKRFEGTPIKGESTEKSYVKKSVRIDLNGEKIFENENVLQKTIIFLEKGSFD